jgi:archaellum component FlaC
MQEIKQEIVGSRDRLLRKIEKLPVEEFWHKELKFDLNDVILGINKFIVESESKINTQEKEIERLKKLEESLSKQIEGISDGAD